MKLSACFQVGRNFHSLTAVGGSLVAAGGYGLNSVEILQGEKGGWSTASWSLKAAVYSHCAVATDTSHIVILGGDNMNRKAFRRKLNNHVG